MGGGGILEAGQEGEEHVWSSLGSLVPQRLGSYSVQRRGQFYFIGVLLESFIYNSQINYKNQKGVCLSGPAKVYDLVRGRCPNYFIN